MWVPFVDQTGPPENPESRNTSSLCRALASTLNPLPSALITPIAVSQYQGQFVSSSSTSASFLPSGDHLARPGLYEPCLPISKRRPDPSRLIIQMPPLIANPTLLPSGNQNAPT